MPFHYKKAGFEKDIHFANMSLLIKLPVKLISFDVCVLITFPDILFIYVRAEFTYNSAAIQNCAVLGSFAHAMVGKAAVLEWLQGLQLSPKLWQLWSNICS